MTRAPLVSRSLRQRAWLGSRVLQRSGLLGRAASFRGRMRVTEMLDRVMASACPAVWPVRESRALAVAVMLRDHGFAAVSPFRNNVSPEPFGRLRSSPPLRGRCPRQGAEGGMQPLVNSGHLRRAERLSPPSVCCRRHLPLKGGEGRCGQISGVPARSLLLTVGGAA